MLGSFAMNFFVVGSLSMILGFILFLQVGANVFLMNARVPASATIIVSNLASLVAFDLYDTDEFYDKLFGYDVFEPHSVSFETFDY